MTFSFQCFAVIVAGGLWCELGVATKFSNTGQVSTGDADSTLIAELVDALGPGHHTGRLGDFETALKRSFASLPKGPDGNLGHRAVRYVLHRLFVQRNGWYIKGLEPNGDAWHTSSNASLQDWVPSFLLGRLEARLGDRGVNLQELAALAAALEDLVNKEADGRLETAYTIQELPTSSRITVKQAEDVLDTYMMVYLLGGELSADSAADLQAKKTRFHAKYTGWKEADTWLHDIEGNRLVSHTSDGVDFATTKKIAEEIGAKYSTFNDQECRDLKSTLIKMESRSGRAGRVRLSDFYNMSLYSHWQFSEKAEYLRSLGALDESTGTPSVIIPNYLTARPNCLEASSLYAMCCRDECEDLLGHIEEKIAAPSAHPDKIASVVSGLPSDTVAAPRVLPAPLLNRLGQIAKAHGGDVNIHGRLFAQWMHHAYPRECPYPHEAGHASPQTADEWMAKTGHASSNVSPEEIRKQVQTISHEDEEYGTEAELPWSEAEQLLDAQPVGAVVKLGEEPRGWFSFFLRILLAGILIAFGVWVRSAPEFARFVRRTLGIQAQVVDGVSTSAFVAAGVPLGLFDRLAFSIMFLGGLGVFTYNRVCKNLDSELLPGGYMKRTGPRFNTRSWRKVADKLV